VTLSNDEVKAYVRDRFELVRLEMRDGDAAQDAAIESLGVGDFPAVLVLDDKGIERYRIVGFEHPEEFLQEVKKGEAELARLTPATDSPTGGG
jgi:thiol:disulfide interchange protein